MTEDLFDTKQKIEAAVSHFKTLKDHPGWQILKQIVDANIVVLQDQILGGIEGETKETIERKRDKLKAYKEVIGIPDYWITRLESPEQFKEEPDPYHTVESWMESRKGN